MVNTPVQFLRDVAARSAALRQYALAHDRYSEVEQMLRLVGSPVEAEGAHVMALRCLRAYRAELDDPSPEVGP